MTTKKIRVAVLFGGKSVEHDISLKSAHNVVENIDKDKFEVTLIGIDRNGGWHLNADTQSISRSRSLAIINGETDHNLVELDNNDHKYPIDVVFPVLHGTDGEDGSIQGLLRASNLPFVGSGVLGSAVSMNKIISKKLLLAAGIPVANFIACTFSEKDHLIYDEVVKKLGSPFIVKPANLGSSVGISKVSDETQFQEALQTSFNFDQEAIIEEFIIGRELECAVMGDENPVASAPGEIIIKGDYEFYDFEAKYVDPDAVEIKIPADANPAQVDEMKQYCVAAFKALCCNDFARVDLFFTDEGKIFINEINTIPGFTNSSMFPLLWENEGISYTELITQLIEMALKRFHKRARAETKFISGLNREV